MRIFKNILKIILILIFVAGCAYAIVRVMSNKVEKIKLDEKIEVDVDLVNKLCKEFGEEVYFFPGDFHKKAIVKNITTYKGVDYSLVYKPQYYYLINEKARNACGTDAQKLIKYFVTVGMPLGERANETFDLTSYYNANKDLRLQFGTDLSSYYRHYMREGHNEPERKCLGVLEIEDPITVYNEFDYAKVFDLKYYMEHYPELHNFLTLKGPGDLANDALAIAHFVESGVNELRQANETFDLVSYFLLNPDLREIYKTNLLAYVIHYVNNDQDDNRPALGRHNIEEFNQVLFDLRPTIEKEAVSMLDYVGHDLYSAYAWCTGINYEFLPLNWSIEGYAMYAFGNWCGNCYAKASAFYYMARELGYDAHIVYGYVPIGEDQHLGPHGWVEIDGAVYDPDFETEMGRNGFAIHYGDSGTWQYSGYWYVN